MIGPLTARDFIARGLDAPAAESMAASVNRALGQDCTRAWREISQRVLCPEHPFALHQFLFKTVHADRAPDAPPPAAWVPTPDEIRATNVGRMMHERGFESVAELHAWSVARREEFWADTIERLGIRLARRWTRLVDLSDGVERPRWLAGAKLNIVESCFTAKRDKTAIVFHDESGNVHTVTYRELSALANRVANGLRRSGIRPGEALAIFLPMTIESVAVYLGIIRAGCVAVSIADSLAAEEIATRLRLSDAKGIVTQNVLLRGGKQLPLYQKVIDAGAPRTVVIGAAERLRSGDLDWDTFLSDDERFETHIADPHERTNILFSSGTTGQPKAIPWTHVTPIKCAVDAYLHQDVQSDDRLAWPTNLGWMMGPWLIYAALVNRSSMAFYAGAPTGRDFGKFVSAAGVTMLGVIPSLVKTWRATNCMRSLDWGAVRRFSSTGECSSADDMLYLMSLAGYKPVIEYCGGTELGGGYIGSTMAQANVPAAFSTASFGVELVMVNDDGSTQTAAAESPTPAGGTHPAGEIFLVPPAIGMSTELLHHDHHAVYFEGTPAGPRGETLRRHGDAMERLGGGYYRALGRVDDTMNLGGIKISSVEIERVLNATSGIRETAAIAVTPPGGGPSLLWIFAVLQSECALDRPAICKDLQDSIRKHLNPLFKIHQLVVVDSLPRTASQKLVRRLLRDNAVGRTKQATSSGPAR
jgi:acetyl-CoA synthetase